MLPWCVVSCAPLVVVSTGGICAGFRTCRTCHRLARVLWWCAPRLLSAFLLCLWCIALEYGSISRFKGVFSGFWGVGVYLYRFGVLRGLCGFCARVELGGLEACGVFRLYFISFASLLSSFLSFCFCVCLSFCPLCSCFYLFSCLPCLSSCPLLVLLSALFILVSLWGLCFPFPFRTIRKKKGRAVLVRPLLSCCVLIIFLCSYRRTPLPLLWLFPVRSVYTPS